LGIVCVVGIETGLGNFQNGMLVTVDGSKGVVYAGAPKVEKVVIKSQDRSGKEVDVKKVKEPKKTATKVDVLIKDIGNAKQAAGMAVDGGVLIVEGLFSQLKYHPEHYIERLKKEDLFEELISSLHEVGEVFNPRPVIYRLWNADNEQTRKMTWGKQYEEEESNPLIGKRGAFRYLNNSKLAELQFSAINQVRKKQGWSNLQVMIPFVRSVDELRELKKLMSVQGLTRSTSIFDGKDGKGGD
jgi:pyruvate,water dikinase